MTDDPKKPPGSDEPHKRPDTDDGWEQPADPIDPATGYVMHPADPSYPGRQDAPASPATGPTSPATSTVDPAPRSASMETGSATTETGSASAETGPSYSELGSGYPETEPAYPETRPSSVDGPVDPDAGPSSPDTGPVYPGGEPFEPSQPPDPVTGYVSYSSPSMDPVTGLPLEEAPAANPDDAPILPPSYDHASLRGDTPVPGAPAPPSPKAKRKRRDDDDDGDDDPRSNRRTVWIVAGSIIAGITIVTFALLGRANSSNYLIACDADKIIAQQGRAFPPWGVSPMQGAEWKPIAIAPNGECKPRETDDADELEGWYLALLIDQASSLLTAREVTKPDVAAEQLNQALLLARSPERRDQRKDIERLLGDVDYWRASAKLRDAATALGDAAKQFDTAAAQRPRHVSDAAAWASYLRKLVDQLHAGPAGGTQTAFPPLPPGVERPPAPPGVALPVEPADHGSDVPTLAPPDAGAPSGGVLL